MFCMHFLVIHLLFLYSSVYAFQKFLQRESRGSQKEEPSLMISNGTVIVGGYQSFSIDENKIITFEGKKYSYVVELLKGLKRVDGCTTFADVGANTGLVSFLASSDMVGFQHAFLLDHDIPCLTIARAISAAINANVTAQRFDFGDPIPTVDVLFCGAIIHWVFCLTADFQGNFDAIVLYLSRSTKKYLVIEWVDKEDGAIRRFDHIGRCGNSEIVAQYNRDFFLKSLLKIGSVQHSRSFGQRTIYTVYINK